MLKTTHKSASLLPGWSEHRAPTGHLYYYNKDTKQSTYTRPIVESKEALQPVHAPVTVPAPAHSTGYSPLQQFPGSKVFEQAGLQSFKHAEQSRWQPQQRGGRQYDRPRQNRRPNHDDRPKHKQSIPGAEPWVLVRTKLRRRFVHNPETGESLWKFPSEVMKCVLDLDHVMRERKERREQGKHNEPDEEKVQTKVAEAKSSGNKDYDSEEYEEVEVTDEEGEETSAKKPRLEDEGKLAEHVEFGEDDIAFQLAQMEAEADDYHGEGTPPQLSDADARALFADLLDDFKLSPYTPWESIIEEGLIIDDDRYTVLPNMKMRREVFDEWCRMRAAKLKEQREKQTKRDPRVFYIAFLAKKATPKLYWQEFRRKYQKEPELKDRQITDKDREKMYREHISRLKLNESDRKRDLRKLLEEIPSRDLNRSSTTASLPDSLLRDLRYIGLPEKVRDSMVETFIETAPSAPPSAGLSTEEEEKMKKGKVERERREKALADRERAVREQKSRARREIGYSKGLLQDEEVELRRAMDIGRKGLLSHMEDSGETSQ